MLMVCKAYSQKAYEQEPPYNIKTISFVKNGINVVPVFKLGESFELQFDDLYGNEEDYYYTITQYNYDWTPTQLSKNEYLNGMDNQRIITYENSFNALQIYSHYKQVFPNRFNQITKSGNYLISIYDDAANLIFSRKFIIYEENVAVGMQIRRPRDFESINEKQNIELVINYGDRILQNPMQNVKILIFKNGNLKDNVVNIKPQYTLGSELIYRYNSETQFWAGNEYYSIDTKLIRATNNTVARVTSGELYNSHLYTNAPRGAFPYTYFPDINGNFFVTNLNSERPEIEADYSWVYFTLDANSIKPDEDIYVCGMFNNHKLSDENKMSYNEKSGLYELSLLLKQGIINYEYVVANKNKKINYKDALDGNFYLAENDYHVLVYYRGNTDRYDKIIAYTKNNSENIIN